MIEEKIEQIFRTKANHHTLRRGHRFRIYMVLVRLTDERKGER